MVRYGEPFMLSSSGSTRATAYGFSNKSVTLDGTTHVVWLDAIAQVCGRSYHHAAKSWSETYYLFTGCDNHTTPALTVDRDGRLRIAYGPHGWWGNWNQARFKWAISQEPGRIDAWTGEQDFGYSATYASMAHTPQGLDVVVYRGGEPPASLMFQRQRRMGGWSTARELMRQDVEPQYTHVNATVISGTDGTLYVAGHFYNVAGDYNGPPEKMRSHGMAVLKSTDLAETWTDLRGEPVAVPTLYQERIAIPPVGADMYVHGIALDSRGDLWALTSSTGVEDTRVLLSRWTNEGWDTTDLQSCLPGDRVAVDGVITIDTADRTHICITALQPAGLIDKSASAAWGLPSCEVYHLMSQPAALDFECNMVSIPDEGLPSWLPNISLGGICSPVEKPVILYTHGDKGEGCSPTTQTEVYCVMIEEIA